MYSCIYFLFWWSSHWWSLSRLILLFLQNGDILIQMNFKAVKPKQNALLFLHWCFEPTHLHFLPVDFPRANSFLHSHVQGDMLVPRVDTQKMLFLLWKDINQRGRQGSVGEMNVRANNYNKNYLRTGRSVELWKKKCLTSLMGVKKASRWRGLNSWIRKFAKGRDNNNNNSPISTSI